MADDILLRSIKPDRDAVSAWRSPRKLIMRCEEYMLIGFSVLLDIVAARLLKNDGGVVPFVPF